jgi:hypothetical protein
MERSPTSLLTRIGLAGGAFAGAAALVGACSSGNPADTSDNQSVVRDGDACSVAPTGESCPCSTQGATVDCGKVVYKNGNYVTCSEGSRTCDGGKWGQCIGAYTVYKSVGSLGADGVHIQDLVASDAGCANACDPNCSSFGGDNSNGLDAAGLQPIDGGWTLVPGEAGGGCTGLECQLVSCDGGLTTTLTGAVYDPAGHNPIYNAQVYVPNSLPLPVFQPGAQKDPCGGGGQLAPTPSPGAYGVTDPAGNFTLTNLPVGNNIPVVIQVGKWRRTFKFNIPACTTTALGHLLLPSTQQQGDMPHIAVATGSCDPMECLLNRIGVSASEFGSPNAGMAVDFYETNGAALTGGTNPFVSNLLSSTAQMQAYDLIMLPCECNWEYSNGVYGYPASYGANLTSYMNNGGRMFTSHWGRQWIEGGGVWAAPFPNVANWYADDKPPYSSSCGLSSCIGYDNPMIGWIDTSLPKGQAFSTWMTNVGATIAPNEFWITPTRFDLLSVTGNSQQWVYAFSDYGAQDQVNPATHNWVPDNIPDFTFNTPVGKNPTYGRVMYTDMHLSVASSIYGASAGTFPSECASGALSPQEKAAEFLLFDLQGCTSSLPPPPPPPQYPPATFTRDFQGVCAPGYKPVWHLFEWEDVTPSDSNITFSAASADTQAQLGEPTVSWVASGPDNCPGGPSCKSSWVAYDIDPAGIDPQGNWSQAWLRVNMTLNPSTNKLSAPTLIGWQQAFSCVPSE